MWSEVRKEWSEGRKCGVRGSEARKCGEEGSEERKEEGG